MASEDALLRIRLRRTGKKKQPFYRVVVADQRAPRDGDFIEVIGQYNPRTQPSTVVLNEERVKHWLSVGAQPSETVHRVLHKAGLMEAAPPKRVTTQSRAEREAEATAAAAAKAAADAAAAAKAEADAAAAAAAEAEASAVESADGDAPAEG
ncbi:MAG: 30S ribosomal protein S16 [Chloroflexi bacterium]|nr:30S ribosomal protein S16 [Chloroflexota bacterium]MDA1147749.1 30S ribosomal protein S16 [Chloroflexota bacterium]